jgi:hypothetical protein
MRIVTTSFVALVAVCLVGTPRLALAADDSAVVGDARGAQSKVDELANEMMQRMMEVEKEVNAKKLPLFAARNEHLRKVEGFWARTIVNHPSHTSWIGGVDREILQFVTDITVEDIDADQHHFKITMTLKQNPHIGNEKLWRKITGHDAASQEVSGVEWLGGNRPEGNTFFGYFESEGEAMDAQTINDVTHVMRYEFYQNPFTYYDIPTYDEIAAEHHALGGAEAAEAEEAAAAAAEAQEEEEA